MSDAAVGTPFAMTNAMKAALRERGHSYADIAEMTPAEAHKIIGNGAAAPQRPVLLEPDQALISIFVETLFRHAGATGFVSIRAFFEDDGAKMPFRISPAALAEFETELEHIAEAETRNLEDLAAAYDDFIDLEDLSSARLIKAAVQYEHAVERLREIHADFDWGRRHASRRLWLLRAGR